MSLCIKTKQATDEGVASGHVRMIVGQELLFLQFKRQVVKEVQETLNLLGMTRNALAKKMKILPSAVTQSLAEDKGLQLTTLVRMADALDCDIEVNFIRRSPGV